MRVTASILLLLTALLGGCAGDEGAVRSVTQQEALAGAGGALLLDVRRPDEYASGHVPGAVNIPHDQLPERLAELDAFRDGEVVVYCESGRRAAIAASVLGEHGFTHIGHLEGDMAGWRAAGLPTEAAER